MGVARIFVGFGNILGGRGGADVFGTINVSVRMRGGRFGGLRGGRGGVCGTFDADGANGLDPTSSRCPKNGLGCVGSEGPERDKLIMSVAAVDNRDIGCIGGAG